MNRQRSEIWFKISSNGDSRSNTYMQARFKKKPEHWDINIVLLRNKVLSQNVGLFYLETGLA